MAAMLVGLDDEDDECEPVRFWFAKKGKECVVGEVWDNVDAVRARFARRFHHLPDEILAVTGFNYDTAEFTFFVAWEGTSDEGQ